MRGPWSVPGLPWPKVIGAPTMAAAERAGFGYGACGVQMSGASVGATRRGTRARREVRAR